MTKNRPRATSIDAVSFLSIVPTLQQTRHISRSRKLLPCQKHTYLVVRVPTYVRNPASLRLKQRILTVHISYFLTTANTTDE